MQIHFTQVRFGPLPSEVLGIASSRPIQIYKPIYKPSYMHKVLNLIYIRQLGFCSQSAGKRHIQTPLSPDTEETKPYREAPQNYYL